MQQWRHSDRQLTMWSGEDEEVPPPLPDDRQRALLLVLAELLLLRAQDPTLRQGRGSGDLDQIDR